MRSLWLASAASLCFAGAAFAQMSQTSPAPTGAPNAPAMTAPGQSPGNAGSSAPSNSMAVPPAAMNNSGAPAVNASGAPGTPTVTAPGASPGKTMSAGSTSSSMGTGAMGGGAMGSKPMMSSTNGMTMVHHHHMMGGYGMAMKMPADGSASTYLHIAKMSIMHHNKMMADDALSHAETRMLDRSVPQGGIAPDSSPAVASIESARKAVMAGDMKTASMDTDMAMQQSMGMSSGDDDMGKGGMSGGGMSSGSMSSGSMGGGSNTGMAHGMETPSDSGGMGSPASTSDSGTVSGGSATGVGKSSMSTTPPSAQKMTQ